MLIICARKGRRVLAPAFFAVAATAAAAQGGRPLDFTAAERSQFEEAPRRVARVALPPIAHSATAAAWIDNDRIVYSTREIVGRWKAAPDELAKVVVLDVRGRSVEETAYRGNLVCFSEKRMLLAVPRFAHAGGFNPQRDTLLAGRFEGQLSRVENVQGREILRYSCELNPIVKQLTSQDEVTDVPLLPGHGFLRLPRGVRLQQGQVPKYEFHADAGRLIGSYAGAGYPQQTQLRYIPWIPAYFASKGSRFGAELLTLRGERRIIDPPELLAGWSLHSNLGGGDAVATRVGTLWNFVTWPSYWRMQGLYLQNESKQQLLRIDDAHVPREPGIAVSPDGCRVFYMRRPGNPEQASQPFQPTVMSLCEGASK